MRNRYETPDPVPSAIPIGFKRPEPMSSLIARLVHGELSRVAEKNGADSFEDSQNFDIPDDPIDAMTKWEEAYLRSETLQREYEEAVAHKREQTLTQWLKSKFSKKAESSSPPPPSPVPPPPPTPEE